MVFGKKEVEVSAPTLGILRYKGGSIELRPPGGPYPGPGTFQFKAADDLQRIETEVGVGDTLVQLLSTSGRLVKITYGNLNWIRGGMGGLTELCYKYFNESASGRAVEGPAKRAGQYQEFGEELKATFLRGGYSAQLLAERLARSTLYSWTDGVAVDHPFKNGATKLTVPEIKTKIELWLSGDLMPATAQWDLASKALEPFMRAGEGSNVLISYDPHNHNGRPAHVGLYHELVHALYYVSGTQLGMEDSQSEINGGRHFEQMSCGFAPHDGKPHSENRYRQAVGWPKRTAY